MFQAEGSTYMKPPRLEDTFVLQSSNKTILKSQSSWNICEWEEWVNEWMRGKMARNEVGKTGKDKIT